jgi:hypothetical protein
VSERKSPPRDVDYEDVDDLIGLAAEMAEADAGKLTVTELESIASEMDIPTEYVAKAVHTLQARRQAEALATHRRLNLRRMMLLGLAAVIGVTGLWTYSVRGTLTNLAADVEAKRAQVASVMERQTKVNARYEGLDATAERDAELAGAENRVRVEMRRYDEAATSYNKAAQGLIANLARGIFNLPSEMPLSSERNGW